MILFAADHGDMLGNHRYWAKDMMNEDSARIPMVLCGRPIHDRTGDHQIDTRLVGLADVMPTLLHAAGIPIPEHCQGQSMLGDAARQYIFCQWGYGAKANLMVRDSRHKLIYFPRANQRLLFDMEQDPRELHNLAGKAELAEVRRRLEGRLIQSLAPDQHQAWVTDGQLTGLPEGEAPAPGPTFGLEGQRGTHWPPPAPR
ncbi:MAG: DUF4976 domain-containing protein [Planctomycetaceae bacterium]|nr:MAG: DUF4976 domain-containing protein [Planctomycetaceae bacterium]